MGLGGRARRFPDLIPLPRVRLFPGACILFYITRYLFRTPSPAHLRPFVSVVLPGANMFVSKKGGQNSETRRSGAGSVQPWTQERRPRSPRVTGLANGVSASGLRFSARRTYRGTAGPVVHDGLVSPLLIRANVPGASCHRVTSRLSRVLT